MSNNQIFRKKVQMIIKLHFFYCSLAHFLLESVVCWFIRSIKFYNYLGARHITTKKKRKNQATNDKFPSNNHCFKARFCTCWSLSKQNADLFGQNGVLTLTKRRSIRNKMKSLKINYLQGGNSCGLCFFANCTKKGVKPESFAP